MPFRDIIALASPYRIRLLLLGILSILGSLAVLVIPALGGRLLGEVLRDQSGSIVATAALLVVAIIASAATTAASALISGRTSARILADLRNRMYAHLQSLPIGYHERQRQGDTLALMTWEVARLGNFLSLTLTSIPAQLLTTAGALVLMLRIDWRLALLVPVLVPAFFIILKLVGRKLRELSVAMQEADAAVLAQAEQDLQMLPATKSFAREEIERGRYAHLVDRAMKLYVRSNDIFAFLDPLIGLSAALGAVALLYFAGGRVQAGSMSPAELFSFLFYAALLTRPVGALANVYGQVQATRGTLARLGRVLAEKPEVGLALEASGFAARGEIVFEGVSFAYEERERVLDGVDLSIAAGEKVALVGDNGAGKTTIASLLLGYYVPQSGKITIDGIDIAQMQLQELRRQIGYVPQRPLLFNGSIRDNIAFGKAGATDAEIEAAAKLAQAQAFIERLPESYDTQIGDNGVRLSGGERQRIALARTLLKDPPIVILDEATSMFDLEGEAGFIAACETALRGRTVLLITHRPASLVLADRLLRVEHKSVGREATVKSRHLAPVKQV